MRDTTDLSSLSSDEIIGKIAELAVAYDGVWIFESIAKLHVLTLILKQAVIREASAGTCHIGMGYNLTLDKPSTPDGDYNLIPKEMA